MSRWMCLAVLSCAVMGAGCASQPKKVYWREMLGKSIAEFGDRLRENNADRIWIHNMVDNACDRGYQKAVEVVCCQDDCKGGGVGGALGALGGGLGGLGALGGSEETGGGSPHDGLAYEVFANYITQKRKGRVVESHHHNYWTELGVDTRRKVDVVQDGKNVGTYLSGEDLCLLDEAKKRKADKVLAYQILEMKPEELTIHLRLSDTKTGVVELSRTLRISGPSVSDWSF